MIEKGFCQCGCGQKTKIAKREDSRKGWIKGEAIRFIQGHHARKSLHPKWKGGRVRVNGYIRIMQPDHPRADKLGYLPEHILIAEKVFGGPLPSKAVVHHINGKRDDNRPENLVICENHGYHRLIHWRELALKACGHADWRKCAFCHRYDDPANLWTSKRNSVSYHKVCQKSYRVMRKAALAASLD